MKSETCSLCFLLLSLFLLTTAVHIEDLVVNHPHAFSSTGNTEEFVESASPFHETVTKIINGNSISYSRYKYMTTEQISSYYSKPDSKSPLKTTLGGTLKRDVKNWVPQYKGSVIPSHKSNKNILYGSITFEAECFKENNATIELDLDKNQIYLTIESHTPKSYLCTDFYFIVSRESYHIKGVFIRGKHSLVISEFKEGELQDIMANGLRIFNFIDGFFGTLIDVYQSYKILYGTLYPKDKIAFLKENMNVTFVERPTKLYMPDEKDIRSGDIFIKDTLSGYDNLIMYGTGGRSGHMFVALWFDDVLYITESTDVGVTKTPYKEWFKEQDPNSMVVVHAHLHSDYQKLFNVTNAVKRFKALEGQPYGYSNFAYGWIDTLQDNYPRPLDEHMVPATMTLADALYPNIIYTGFLEGLNNRFKHYFGISNPNCTNLDCVFKYLDMVNASLAETLTIVEQDDWDYPQGKQFVCSAYIMSIYKAAGIFGDLSDSLIATEFTPKDMYQLKVFENPDYSTIPEQCRVKGYNYCQIVGKWYWELPGFNSIAPYAHMNEKCGAYPPEYKRAPEGC